MNQCAISIKLTRAVILSPKIMDLSNTFSSKGTIALIRYTSHNTIHERIILTPPNPNTLNTEDY